MKKLFGCEKCKETFNTEEECKKHERLCQKNNDELIEELFKIVDEQEEHITDLQKQIKTLESYIDILKGGQTITLPSTPSYPSYPSYPTYPSTPTPTYPWQSPIVWCSTKTTLSTSEPSVTISAGNATTALEDKKQEAGLNSNENKA